jgi:type I restriction enzyme S subunit
MAYKPIIIDRQNLTIMGVQFPDLQTLESAAVGIGTDMFDRYARFNSWDSAREVFTFDEMKQVKISILNIEVQKDIAAIFKAYAARRNIAEKIKVQVKAMCSVLVSGVVEEERYEEADI